MGLASSRHDKVAVFIDNGYLARVLKREFDEPRMDYLKFSEAFCRDCERFRTYFYFCMPYQSPAPTQDERARISQAQAFYYNLRRLPRFEVRLGRLIKTSSSPQRYEQKGVDVLLSVDLVRLSWSRTIDRAILVTGDSDFIPAIQASKDAGIIIELCHSEGQHVSAELFQACDERHPISKALVESCAL